MRKTTAVTGIVLVASTALGVSACGQVEPKVAFGKAYASTISQKDLSTTVSLKTTEADIKKLITALDTKGDLDTNPSSKMVADTLAKTLPKLTMTSKAHSNGAALDAETDKTKLDQAASIAIDGAGLDLVTIGKEIFFKANVEGIGQKTGLFTLSQAKMLLAEAPPEMSWLGDVVDGKWIGLPASFTDKALSSKDASALNDPVKLKELRSKMQASMEKNATFEKVGDDRIDVKIKLKPFLKDMQAATASMTASASASATASATPSTSSAADDMKGLKDDAVLTLKTTVKDDRVTQTEMDLPQVWGWVDESTMKDSEKADFAKAKNSGFAGSVLVTTSTDAAAVTKPSGARMLTDTELEPLTQSLDSATATPAL